MKKSIGYLIIISMFLFSGCNFEKLLGSGYSSTACYIESAETYDAVPGQFAKFVITVTNSGEATAYNVNCSIKLKNGNTIIESGIGSFGSLNQGESAVDEVWFTKINKHTDYESYEIILSWYDDEGVYYENP